MLYGEFLHMRWHVFTLSLLLTAWDFTLEHCLRALVGLVSCKALSLGRQSTALGALNGLLRALGQVDGHYTLIRVLVVTVLTVEKPKLADIFLMLANFIAWESFSTPLAMDRCEITAI